MTARDGAGTDVLLKPGAAAFATIYQRAEQYALEK
jgi:hypothetical protein